MNPSPTFFRGKKILVTGATGSIGSEVVRQLLECDPAVIRLFSRDEHKHFLLEQELGKRGNIRHLLGDVRDRDRLQSAMEDIEYVFHCAAYKHVPLCEYNSYEAVKTNVVGTQNVVDAALRQNVERVLLVSTDKAASPTSVMGATKLLAEKLMTSAMQSKGSHRTVFGSVRFGNVLGSRGSVIPTFMKQIEKGGPVTLTAPEMTRFFMSVADAVRLTFAAMEQMNGGEVFILKMPVLRLQDLADVLIEELAPRFGYDPAAIQCSVIGVRPGEKMQELLMTQEEAPFAIEKDTMFIVQSPLPMMGEESVTPSGTGTSYGSGDQKPLSKDDIRMLVAPFLSE